MPTTLKLKNSVTAAATPTTLVQGEAAVNVTDKKVWVGNAASSPVQIIGAGATVAGTTATLSSLTSGRVLYAGTSGLIQDDADFTFNGTTVTMANDASISGLTVGKGGGAVATNTVLGNGALATNTTGGSNTAMGESALGANTTASNNTAVGYQAGVANTTGRITAFGHRVLYSNTTGAGNTGIGGNDGSVGSALLSNTTGNYNIAVGTGSLQNNTTASNNTAVGYQAGYSNTTGDAITAVGYRALYTNTTGTNCTAVGHSALLLNTTSVNNVAVGDFALRANTTGEGSSAVGTDALRANTTGGNNTAIGHLAGSGITTGQYNNIFGSRNTTLTTGEYNIQIGRFANASASSVSYALMINTDNTARTDKGSSTGFIFTGGGMFQGNNSASWSTTSDQRLKKNIVDNTDGLAKITAIQVRNFEYRTADEITDLPKDQAVEVKGIQLGAIAQEIQAILPECVKTESTGVMSVDTTNLTWYLINAVKQLSAEVDSLKQQINGA